MKLSFATLFSIVMSCPSNATITTSMFFDLDRDASRHSHTPMFYGAVPNSTIRKLQATREGMLRAKQSRTCTGMMP